MTQYTYTLTPTAGTIIEEESEALNMPPDRYLSKLILDTHVECQAQRVLNAFEEWLEALVALAHSSSKHEPEFVVVLHKLTTLKKQIIGDLK